MGIVMKKSTFTSVPGILRPFREYLGTRLSTGDQIVYYGCPGTCTPFVELLAFSIRKMPVEQVFVPFLDEKRAGKLNEIPGVGMQVNEAAQIMKPAAVVLMGGLSMPDVPVKPQDARLTIDRYPGACKIGICFMHMFEKTGWLEEIKFDLLIDATIDPVEVWQ